MNKVATSFGPLKLDGQSFAKAALVNSYSVQSLGDFKPDQGQTSLCNQLEKRLELNTPEIQQRRCSFFKIQGTQATDFRELTIEVSDNKSVLVGIRHMNLSPEDPYLDIWPNWQLTSESDLDAIIKATVPEYRVFNPKHLGLWLKPQADLIQQISHRTKIGQHILAALGSDISNCSKPENYEHISLKPITDDSFYDKYAGDYAEFHRNSPQLQAKVPVVQKKEMIQSIDEGLIFKAFFGGEEVGLIAARREDFLGHPGIYYLEILLTPLFKGRHLASALQRAFVEIISKKEVNPIFWGTIDSSNTPSLRTALRVGRKIVSTECFYSLNI
jgi:hypothetical protein